MRNLKSNEPLTTWPSFAKAAAVLARLSGFQGYPHDEAGREMFIEALMFAVSPEHARAVTNCFDEKFPTLREVKDALTRTRSEFRQWNPDPGCAKCDGTGFQIIHRCFADAALKCDCWGDFPEREMKPQPVGKDGRKVFETADAEIRKGIHEAAEKMALKSGRKTPPEPQG